MNNKIQLLLVFILTMTLHTFAQDNTRGIRAGFNYSMGKQQLFPFNSPDYSYNTKGYKLILNYPLKVSKFSYEIQLEPSVYYAKHELLNQYYVQPVDGSDYLYQREVFTKNKTITEYALNIGMVIRYNMIERLSLFILASVGPMYSDTETERLAKGFAFSDIFAFGAGLKVKKMMFELRPGIRHVSNANLQSPNSGHNSSTLDFGISFLF